jgi:5-oxoprolinase (ATP-hydrolysing)
MPDCFPETFGPDRSASLDMEIVKNKILALAEEINAAMETALSIQDVAAGFLRVANEKMALAIKEISLSRGFDIRNDALVCFGGAGGQHACSIAALLDIKQIIIHPLSGVMSAYGIGLAKPAWKSSRSVLREYDCQCHEELLNYFKEMEDELYSHVQRHHKKFSVRRDVDLRPRGTETFLTMEYGDFKKTVGDFKHHYSTLFGFSPEDVPLEIVNVKVEIRESEVFIPSFSTADKTGGYEPPPLSSQEVYYPQGWVNARVFRREAIPPLVNIPGPAIIIDSQFTVVVDPEFEAQGDESGIITMNKRSHQMRDRSLQSGKADPVLLEVFNNLFMGIATEMGLALKSTAYSVNMKERLDFSCALFDSSGSLVANAPHIPVHLGSMADTVKALIEDRSDHIEPGDIYLTNNPYRGGSHLPDMTVICPVFSEERKLIFFTAARGHHSDVGGMTPGSMPPSASHIDEEGVLIDNVLLVRNDHFREGELKDILLNHSYPARNIAERISDCRAQVAACHKGVIELQRIIERYGLGTVQDYMHHIQENSEYSVKKALCRFIEDSGSFQSAFEDSLDDGTAVKATISIEGGWNPPETLKATIDFSGTGEQHMHDNLNAPASVTRSAVLYVLRALIDRSIPLNSGCLKPVDIIIPEGTILSPEYPAPVASGNVETSQRVVDVLLGTMGITAASQGTMNNLLFEVHGEPPYYETIAGGAGAMNDCPGASGVQVHMTNTRMTDPEVLEFRHPGVRLEQFTMRRGSGGRGEFPGGEGVIREMKFIKPATVSIISERRKTAPYGSNGGRPGKKGVNYHKKANGHIEKLGHREVIDMKIGDSVIIETPGGGGYGRGSQ